MKTVISITSNRSPRHPWRLLASALWVSALTLTAQAQTLVNPSFEADTFTAYPGWQFLNGPVTGWGGPDTFGLNPVDGLYPYADNGVIPDGLQVAFLEGNGSITQRVSGFVVGAEYVVTYWENARAGDAPALRVSVGGPGLRTQIITPVHLVNSGEYREVTSSPFIAVSPEMVLTFTTTSPLGGGPQGNHVLLLDHVGLSQISTPPTPPATAGTLLAYDGFDYPVGMQLHNVTPGGFGWAGGYTKEVYGGTTYENEGPLVEAGSLAYGPLATTGNRVSLNDRRTQRLLDLDAVPEDLKSASSDVTTSGTVIRATGKSIWLSLLGYQASEELTQFFGLSLFRGTNEIIFLGKAGGVTPQAVVWKIEGKFPNTTGASTNLATSPTLLVARIDWNHDGTFREVYTTNLATQVITTNRVPVNPDRAYLWVNPDPELTAPTLETASASGVGVRNEVQARGDFLYSFDRVGFRGGNGNSGVVDEFRLGTTYQSVVPTIFSQLDLSATRTAAGTKIQWRTAPGVVLKVTDNLTAPEWALVPGTPQTEGEWSYFLITNPGAAAFYRLFGDQ